MEGHLVNGGIAVCLVSVSQGVMALLSVCVMPLSYNAAMPRNVFLNICLIKWSGVSCYVKESSWSLEVFSDKHVLLTSGSTDGELVVNRALVLGRLMKQDTRRPAEQ